MKRYTELVIGALLLLPGCSAATGTTTPAPSPSDMTAEEYEALYRQRLENARSHYTDADVRFMTHMIHHHAQALEMSDLVPERTQNPRIRVLASRIINAQNDEIAIMRRWLTDRGLPAPQVGTASGHQAAGHEAMEHDHGQSMQMPGMLSPEEMARLRAARGAEFDRLFLTSMIRHHEGAVTMVHDLFATDGAAQDEEVFKFASDAQVDQSTEVDRMRAMLLTLPPTGADR